MNTIRGQGIEFDPMIGHPALKGMSNSADYIARITELERELQLTREVIKPFADFIGRMGSAPSDAKVAEFFQFYLTAKDFRRLAACGNPE